MLFLVVNQGYFPMSPQPVSMWAAPTPGGPPGPSRRKWFRPEMDAKSKIPPGKTNYALMPPEPLGVGNRTSNGELGVEPSPGFFFFFFF